MVSHRRQLLAASCVTGCLLLAAVLAVGSNLRTNVEAAGPWTVSLTGIDGTGVTSLSGETCDQANGQLTSAQTAGTQLSLLVGPTGFPTLTSSNTTIATDSAQGCSTLTLSGSTTLFGQAANVLVVAQWGDSTSTTPTFSMLFQFSNVGLTSLLGNGSSSNLGVSFGRAWVAVTTGSSGTSLSSADLADASTFLQDAGGNDTGTLNIAGSGVTFRGADLTGDLATGLADVGVSGVQIDGSLTGSVSGFSTASPPNVSVGLDLIASINLSVTTPSWLTLTNPFALEIKGDNSGDWSVTASGAGTLQLPSQTTASSVTASITISKDTGGVTVSLSGTVSEIDNPFGLSWLTLGNTALNLVITSKEVSGTLSSTASIDSHTFTVTVSASSSGTLSVALSSADTIDVNSLATALGLSLPGNTPTFSLSSPILYLQVQKGSVIFAATATATVQFPWSNNPLGVNVLLRDELGGTGGLLVALSPAGQVTLSDLIGNSAIQPDFTLPQISVVLATSAISEDWSSLDPPTQTYFQNILCSGGTDCPDTLDIAKGVGISASIDIPPQLETMFCTLLGEKTCTNPFHGPIVIDGQIPIFGSGPVSLTVSLPPIDTGSSAVPQFSAFLSLSYVSGNFSVSLGGDLVLIVPGSGGICPDGVTAPDSTHTCITVSVEGTLSVGTGGGISVQLTGSLEGNGWKLPAPVDWLTLNNVTLQIGVSAGEDVGVTLGARASITIGSANDLDVAIDMEMLATPPFVNLLGFTVASQQGLSMDDIAALYHDVSGKTVPAGTLPPLAVRNIFLSFSQVQDQALCLMPGLYISGDLVLTNAGSTNVQGVTPSSQPCGFDPTSSPPPKSTACADDSSSCLASIYLSIGGGGITGEGYLGPWSAGPLSFQPTSLDFTLNESEVQVDISGGGQLLDPVLYKTEGNSAPVWAKGNLDLEVGTEALALDGSVQIGDKSATINASGSFNLSNPGFNLTTWFNDVGSAFTTANAKVTNAINSAASTADAWYSTYQSSIMDVANDTQSAYDALHESGPQQWQALWNLYGSVVSQVNSVNSTFDSNKLSRFDIPTSAILPIALHGYSFPGYQICVLHICATIVPAFTIAGICPYPGLQACSVPDSAIVGALQEEFANPSVDSNLAAAGLQLPANASEQEVVSRIHFIDPPGPSTVTCAMATVDYSAGTESNTTVGIDSLGTHLSIAGPTPGDLGNSNLESQNDQILSQNTFNGLYTGTNAGTCTAAPAGFTLPPLAFGLDHGWIVAGATVTATGTASDTSITSVTLDWGDGSPATTVAVTGGTFQAAHTYSNVSGSPFTITASAEGITPVTQQIWVFPAPATISVALTEPATGTPVYGQPVTFTATVTPAGDGQTLTASDVNEGRVTFIDVATSTTLCSGVAVNSGSATCELAAGSAKLAAFHAATHSIVADYTDEGANANFAASNNAATPLEQVVEKANLSAVLTASANPAVYGQPQTLTLSVTVVGPSTLLPTDDPDTTNSQGVASFDLGQMPGATATFCDAQNLSAGDNANDIATCMLDNAQLASLHPGSYSLQAWFGYADGTDDFAATSANGLGSDNGHLVVSAAQTTTTTETTVSENGPGLVVIIKATVTANVPGVLNPDSEGTVTFSDGQGVLCTVMLSGNQADCTASGVTPGGGEITVAYGGSTDFVGSQTTTDAGPLGGPVIVNVSVINDPQWLVSGGGFTGTSSVTVCGVSVPFTVLSAEDLLVGMPNLPGPQQCSMGVVAAGGTATANVLLVTEPVPGAPVAVYPGSGSTGTGGTTAGTCAVDTLELSARWTLVAWPGADIDPGKALAATADGCTTNVAPDIAVIWGFDASTQTWQAYFPGATAQGANDLTELVRGMGYFVALANPGGTVSWRVETGS